MGFVVGLGSGWRSYQKDFIRTLVGARGAGRAAHAYTPPPKAALPPHTGARLNLIRIVPASGISSLGQPLALRNGEGHMFICRTGRSRPPTGASTPCTTPYRPVAKPPPPL